MRIRIYTDGACSKNPGPGGWAAIILFPNTKQVIAGNERETTNNRMELRAVVESLRVAIKANKDDCKIDVYSDSAYVVNAIRDKWLKKWKENGWMTKAQTPVKNKDLWLLLSNIIDKNRNVNLIKVKGHSGNEYNERCDKIARYQVFKLKDL